MFALVLSYYFMLWLLILYSLLLAQSSRFWLLATLCTTEQNSVWAFCTASHFPTLYQTVLHWYPHDFHGQFFQKWVARSFLLLCLSQEAPPKPWNLSIMGDPAGIWNTSGISFSITATGSHNSITTDRWLVWFPDWERTPGHSGESTDS